MSERILVHEVTLDGYKATSDHKTLDFGTWGSYGIEKLHLTLGKAWEGLVITAHFNVKGEVVATALADVDNMMDVPWEALKDNTFAGRIVFQGDMNGARRLTANLNFKVTNHADFVGSDPVPTDDKWNQFVTETKNYREDAMDAAERAMQTETEVGALGDEKKQALQEESEKQQDAIEKKGKDTLESIPEEYTELNKDVAQLKNDIAESYSAKKIYSSGDICIYDNTLYRRKSDAAAEEEWNAEHWTEISVGTQFKRVAAETGYLGKISAEISNRYNLFNKSDPDNTIDAYSGTETGYIAPSTITRSVVIKCEPLTKYTVSRAAGNYSRFGIVSLDHYPGSKDSGDFVANILDSHTGRLPLQTDGVRDWYTFTTNSAAEYIFVFYCHTGHDKVSDNELRDSICISLGENHDYYTYDFADVRIKDALLSEIMQRIPGRVETLENSASGGNDGFIPYLATRALHLGDNLFDSSAATAGNGWTINGDTIAHAADGTEDLILPIDGVVGDKYIVEFDSNFYQEEFVTVGTDEKNLSFVYNGTDHLVIPVEIISQAKLIIRPYNEKQFELSNISIRRIQPSGTEYNLNYISAVTSNNYGNYGNRNVLIGYDSATHAVGSTRLVAIGNAVLKNLLAGHRNIGIGGSALQNLESGDENIAIGADAGIYMYTGKSNIAIGLGSCSNGHNMMGNVALGQYALHGAADGEAADCIALGRMAGYQNQANNNIYIGHMAGYSNKTGQNNVFVGADTTYSATGDYNVFLGSGAYAAVAEANDSIGIGHAARPSKSNQMVLGGTMITEVVFCGNKKINFNADGTVTWESI